VAEWTFLSNYGLVLLCIAEDPDARLRDVGARVGITERAAHRIVTELVEAGYLVRERDGRRNRYEINDERELPEPLAGDRKLGDLLRALTPREAAGGSHPPRPA
jgi:DNA-binding transcriptional ArsR family regulator